MMHLKCLKKDNLFLRKFYKISLIIHFMPKKKRDGKKVWWIIGIVVLIAIILFVLVKGWTGVENAPPFYENILCDSSQASGSAVSAGSEQLPDQIFLKKCRQVSCGCPVGRSCVESHCSHTCLLGYHLWCSGNCYCWNENPLSRYGENVGCVNTGENTPN